MTATRQVSWGDALVVQQFKHPGGLKAAVETIRSVVGPLAGSRPTFQKFLIVADPSTLHEKDRFRAWLLLAAFGEEPADWGIEDSAVPAAFGDPDQLKAELLWRGAVSGDTPHGLADEPTVTYSRKGSEIGTAGPLFRYVA